jgi:Flp pilus assembly protein TadD
MLDFLGRRNYLKIDGHQGEKMPPKLEELYEQGMNAFNKNEYGIAELAFLQILSTKPDFADIQNKMGIIYHQTNRRELAVRAFEKAIELNPGYTEASLNLAVALSEHGDYEKAREVFEKAARFTGQAAAAPVDKTKSLQACSRSFCQRQARRRASPLRQAVLWHGAPG